MMIWSLQFCVGLLVANAGEWCMHRYLLHYYGKRAGSFWAYHWEEHHYAHLKPYWAKNICLGIMSIIYLMVILTGV